MKPSLLATMLLAAPIGACATMPAPHPEPAGPPEQACVREPGQSFTGKMASAETGAEILAATGARSLRWAPPRSAMTMDFRADRVTVGYDDKMVITSVACG